MIFERVPILRAMPIPGGISAALRYGFTPMERFERLGTPPMVTMTSAA